MCLQIAIITIPFLHAYSSCFCLHSFLIIRDVHVYANHTVTVCTNWYDMVLLTTRDCYPYTSRCLIS